MQRAVDNLIRDLTDLKTGQFLVVTGAGISRASGIDTFRGSEPGAVWKQSDMTLATRETLERDPVRQWSWYLQRFRAVHGAKPNPAHRALVSLGASLADRSIELRLVTQNIDTLHEAAGSHDLIKVHGTSDRIRCSRNGCRYGAPSGSLPFVPSHFDRFEVAPSRESLPRCPDCGAILRAHVLFFDEYYLEHQDYRFAEAEVLAATADRMLFVGTSFSVGVTDLYLRAGARRGIPMWSIDPHAPEPTIQGLRTLPYPAEDFLPACSEALR